MLLIFHLIPYKNPEETIVTKSQFFTTYNRGTIILGQESDGSPYGGFFDSSQAFSGKMTQSEMWSIELSKSDIQKMSSCREASVRPSERIVTWNVKDYSIHNVDITDATLDSLCKTEAMNNHLIWVDSISQSSIKRMCDQIGGQLPIMNDSIASIQQVHDTKLAAFKPFQKDAESCFRDDSQIVFWTGLTREPEDQIWYNPYDPSQEVGTFPDIYLNPAENCMNLVGYLKQVFNCEQVYPCGICEIPNNQLYYMKGLCQEDKAKFFDFRYYIHGLKNRRPFFK